MTGDLWLRCPENYHRNVSCVVQDLSRNSQHRLRLLPTLLSMDLSTTWKTTSSLERKERDVELSLGFQYLQRATQFFRSFSANDQPDLCAQPEKLYRSDSGAEWKLDEAIRLLQ